jgi:hypothetical protein
LQIGAIIQFVDKWELGPELAFVLPALSRRNGLFTDMVDLVRRAFARPAIADAPRNAVKAITIPTVTLTLADQWAKLSGILTGAVKQAENARHLQKAATQQLDLAQYALSTLVDELSAVMSVEGRRDRKAELYILGAGLDTSAGNQRRTAGGRALAA